MAEGPGLPLSMTCSHVANYDNESMSESHDLCLNRGSFSNPFIEPGDPLPLVFILNCMIDRHLDTDGFLLIIKKVIVFGVPYGTKTVGNDAALGIVGIEGYVSCIHPAVDPAASIQHELTKGDDIHAYSIEVFILREFATLEEPEEYFNFVRGCGFPDSFELFLLIWVILTVIVLLDPKTTPCFGFCNSFPIDQVEFPFSGIDAPDEIPLDFVNGIKSFPGMSYVLNDMRGDGTQGGFGKDSPAYHFHHISFPASKLVAHGVQDELEVNMDRPLVEDGESIYFPKLLIFFILSKLLVPSEVSKNSRDGVTVLWCGLSHESEVIIKEKIGDFGPFSGARFGFLLDEELKKAAADKDVRVAITDKISRECIGQEIDLMISGDQLVKAMTYIADLKSFWVVFSLPSDFEPSIPDGCDSKLKGDVSNLVHSLQPILDVIV
ncbi:hypothetical protein CQW23_09895 [Capsicum baccatum]|uniref:Uncharacterized protein n=1 Tax=Capsicum baccatum TaxID=33114 RepID=A0A2G2WY37_CAPBA|nr:hypothetical protein CQW23_09895 [Capsicum baccatum]